MKKSFHIMALTMATMMMAGIAMAGSVDIGMGRMDQSEFTALQQMVSGDYQPSVSISTKIPEYTRVAEFNLADVDDIRQAMASGNAQQHATESVANNAMVDIGTGAMATGEFCDLNKLVASNNSGPSKGFAFVCP